MIKLPHDLYDHFINDYIELLLRKGFKESFFKLISKAADHNKAYRIPDEQKEDFLRTVLGNPFSNEARKKYSLLEDYFQYVNDENNPNPIASITVLKGDKLLTLRDIFDYQKYMDKSENRKKLRVCIIEAAGVEVCPYCNRQYIDVFDKNNGESKAIAQLDHYYPKEEYPLYALSLYNLIPSCASCNQGKSTSYKGVIYPFSKTADVENEQPYFQLKAKNLDDLLGKTLPKIEYAFNDQAKTEHANFFHHKNMYENHRLFAQRLLRAQRLDNEGYRQGINEIFKKAKIHLEPNDLKELLYGFNGSDEELLQKPLSKLARDIIPSLKK